MAGFGQWAVLNSAVELGRNIHGSCADYFAPMILRVGKIFLGNLFSQHKLAAPSAKAIFKSRGIGVR